MNDVIFCRESGEDMNGKNWFVILYTQRSSLFSISLNMFLNFSKNVSNLIYVFLYEW
jgi:hypothetical protein